MAVIQQVYFAKEGYSIYIRAIKPDEDNPESGLIWISGNPSRLVRRERYHIDIASRLVISAIGIARENPEYDMEQVLISALLEWNIRC